MNNKPQICLSYNKHGWIDCLKNKLKISAVAITLTYFCEYLFVQTLPFEQTQSVVMIQETKSIIEVQIKLYHMVQETY